MTMPDSFYTDTEDASLAPLSFVFYLMEPEPRQEIIEHALKSRPSVPAELRDRLNRAVNCNVPRLSGFRNASLAPPAYILPQLCEAIPHAADLASAVAGVWYEVQGELRDAVASELGEREVPLTNQLTNQSPPVEEVRVGASTGLIYEALNHYCDSHPDADRNHVVFMFQLLTGATDVHVNPEEGVQEMAGLLDATLMALQAAPATGPEWEEMIPEFSATLATLVERKQEERKLVVPFKELLDSIAEEYDQLLHFFQCDTTAWSLEFIPPAFTFQRAHEQGKALRDLLSQYLPIHERAPVVVEELERAGRRAELMPRIMAAAESLGRLLAGEEVQETNDTQEADDSEPECSGRSPSPAVASEEEDDSGYGYVPVCDMEAINELHTTLQDLEEENIDLEHENQGLKVQVKNLERQLYESRSREEGWQLAQTYQDQPAEDSEEPEPADVNAAVELARERYSEQLFFQLNAESDARDSDFTRPDRVWRALRWLATDYFSSRMGQNPICNMNESCRLACDMWYKTSQHETTMTQFPNAYSTRIEGRLIWLGEHIGRGTGFDPRYTIRIAFDWDRQLQKVVIGYIGQHQRTAAT